MLVSTAPQGRQVRRHPPPAVPFLVSVGCRVVVPVVLEVGLDVREEQEEGILLVGVDVADSCVGQRVHPVARQIDRLVVAVEHTGLVGV